MENTYRDRIYSHYCSSAKSHVAFGSTERLQSRAPSTLKLITDHFPKDRSASILDLGCGCGAVGYFARQLGYDNYVGLDVSAEQVQSAEELGIATVVQADLFTFVKTLTADSLDVVITFDVIEHFTKEQMLNVLDHVRRVLKAGGRWIIHIPNGASPFFGRVRYGDFTHELAFTDDSITQLLRASGFRRIECYEDVPVCHGFTSSLRYFLWHAIRFSLNLCVAIETGSYARNPIFSQNFLVVAKK